MQETSFKVTSGEYKGRTVVARTFESVSDFRDMVTSPGVADEIEKRFPRGSGFGWASHLSRKDLLAALKSGGSASDAAGAQEFIDKIDRPDLTAYKTEGVLEVAGGAPVVPLFLAGDPFCMVDAQAVECDRAPIRIFVETISSAGINESAMRRRGYAVIALAQILSEIRPVEVWFVCTLDARRFGPAGSRFASTGATSMRVKLSSPFSLAEAGLLFGCYGVTRALCYNAGRYFDGFTGFWPFGSFPAAGDASTTRAGLEDVLGPCDLVIPQVSLSDEIITDPVRWINGRVADAVRSTQEEV